jgi:hypothetical protein
MLVALCLPAVTSVLWVAGRVLGGVGWRPSSASTRQAQHSDQVAYRLALGERRFRDKKHIRAFEIGSIAIQGSDEGDKSLERPSDNVIGHGAYRRFLS